MDTKETTSNSIIHKSLHMAFCFLFYSIFARNFSYSKTTALFDFFYNTISANKDVISESKRNLYAAAYEKSSSLKTSFDWHRAFPLDEKINADNSSTDIPVFTFKRGKRF